MPPRPSHRLDLILVPPDEPGALARVLALETRWRAAGFLEGNGPGERGSELVAGSFRYMRVDDPGQRVLYANQQGGFQVRCRACGASVAAQFRPLGRTSCECGVESTVEELACRPPVAVSRAALVLADVGDSQISEIPANWALIWRRVSP